MIKGDLSVDDRGTVRFINDFNFENVKRFYQVENHETGFIRAWHGHRKESKYVYVAKGTILLGVVDLTSEIVTKYVLSASKPSILYIPQNHANGFQTLEKDTIVIFFSTKSLSESLNDDERFDYNRWNIWEKNYR